MLKNVKNQSGRHLFDQNWSIKLRKGKWKGCSENTSAIITDSPYEEPVTVFPNDYGYYKQLFGQLESSKLINNKEYEFNDLDAYLELANTKELNNILYDMHVTSTGDQYLDVWKKAPKYCLSLIFFLLSVLYPNLPFGKSVGKF